MVDRPSSTASELSRAEKVAGVPAFLRKVARYRPRIVCFIGREIGDAFETAVRQSLKPSDVTSSKNSSTKRKSTAKPGSIAATSDTEAPTPVPNVLDRKAADYVTPLLTTPGFGLLPYKLVHAHTKPFSPLTSDYKLEDRVQLLRVLREEKDAVVSGATDTSDMTTIPPTLYEVDETRTKSRFFIPRGGPEAPAV
ncbi:hypothetical protein FRC00_010510 [Tulasnella sp. 408]|nr:hypothetical protein FRC00_010510 [Tulasnella sp. 408]